MPNKSKICRYCNCSYVKDKNCTGEYCQQCSKIKFKSSVEDEIMLNKFKNE